MDVRKFPLVSQQVDYVEVALIIHELETVLAANIPGDVVEFGCYEGTTSLFLQRALLDHKKSLHVYDSFEGLPLKTTPDESPAGLQFKAGELAATKKQFIKNFRQAHLKLPVIHKGWFDQLDQKDIPAQICFAFLDGDYYQSIADSLRLIESSLVSGAIIVVDDYQSEALPGAKRAVDEWVRTSGKVTKLHISHSLAILKLTGE